jgi:hypothetical protein
MPSDGLLAAQVVTQEIQMEELPVVPVDLVVVVMVLMQQVTQALRMVYQILVEVEVVQQVSIRLDQ